jgi:putative endonuclease
VRDRLAARPRIGRQAEDLAAKFLESLGYRIDVRNWRATHPETGELDLVADDHGTCVFVEVRSRTRDDIHPLETITPQKRSRIVHAARLYLAAESHAAAAYRFDIIAVRLIDGCEPSITHVPNAFELG